MSIAKCHCTSEGLKAAPHGDPSGANPMKGVCSYAQGSACSTTALRAVTLLFGVACLPLFYALHRRLHPQTATVGNSLGTVSVSIGLVRDVALAVGCC